MGISRDVGREGLSLLSGIELMAAGREPSDNRIGNAFDPQGWDRDPYIPRAGIEVLDPQSQPIGKPASMIQGELGNLLGGIGAAARGAVLIGPQMARQDEGLASPARQPR